MLLANARFIGDAALSVEPSIALAVVELIAGILMPGCRRIGLGGSGLVLALSNGVVKLIVARNLSGELSPG